MTLHAHRRRDRRRCHRVRVLLNGRDVTPRCFYADGRRGVARLYILDAGGKKYVAADGVIAQEEIHGRVRFVWPVQR